MSVLAVAARRFAGADAVLRAALGTRYTAAVLRVELGGELAYEAPYGALDAGVAAQRIDGSTRFDLASLTKIFVTTAALRAVADRRLDLDAPLAHDVVPEWRGTEHETISARALLAHVAGMQSGADYRTLLGDDVERFALLRPLVARPGERVVYSDLGFIALGVVLSRTHGRALRGVVTSTCQALGSRATAYGSHAPQTGVPATEDDGWRGRLRGVVHDEKAYLMGGVAGHAGLFGTASDVAKLAEAYLGPANGRPCGAIPHSLAAEAIVQAASDPVLRRGLGWALKTTDQNSCGRRMDAATFGHTGFTGTCMWADPRRDLSIVLLTNAVYYGRSDIRALRAAVCDAVVEGVEQ